MREERCSRDYLRYESLYVDMLAARRDLVCSMRVLGPASNRVPYVCFGGAAKVRYGVAQACGQCCTSWLMARMGVVVFVMLGAVLLVCQCPKKELGCR